MTRERVARLMEHLGLHGIYPQRDLSKRDLQHLKYPYLLRDVVVAPVDQVWVQTARTYGSTEDLSPRDCNRRAPGRREGRTAYGDHEHSG